MYPRLMHRVPGLPSLACLGRGHRLMANIVVTSTVDPCGSAHSRLHEFVRVLGEKHKVSVLSVQEMQRGRSIDTSEYRRSAQRYLRTAEEHHLSAGTRLPMVLQELFSRWLLEKHTAL